MNDKQLAVKNCELDLIEAQIALRHAELELLHGETRLKSKYDEGVASLEMAVESAQNHVAREKAYLAKAKDDLETGFETQSPMSPRIGILGGAGAIASARFHLDLVRAWARVREAKTDDDFPEIIHVSRPLELGAEGVIDPRATQEAIWHSLRRLYGCTHIAVLCNSITAHVSAIPCVLTPVEACRKALQGVSRAWLLASDSTIRDRIYQNAYPEIEWMAPKVSMTPLIQQSLSHGADLFSLDIQTDDTVVLGCTELSTVRMDLPNAVSPTDEMIEILCSLPCNTSP